MRMLALGLVGILVASGAPETQTASAIVRDTGVTIRTFQFRPTSLSIPVGTRVVWSNGDEIEHTITAGLPDSATGAFTGTVKSQGATFAHTFTRTGRFPYFCDRHHFMRGEIRVTSTGEN